ncbi:S66 peptidase family protein [Flavitalea sp.]|nr:LD-carboxypeptidase [Flavitalea sp.]
MHRKAFLSFVTGALSIPSLSFAKDFVKETSTFTVPPYLKKGDLIGITCPAGFISHEAIRPSINLMESWGYRIKIGNTVGKRDFTFGGSDQERMLDLQDMIDDPEVRAIMCARGGYGAVRFIDQIKFDKIKTNPKWIIGFSDITVIHSHLAANFQVASIHSKMCNSFPDDWNLADPMQVDTILSIRDALSGKTRVYNTIPHPQNRKGIGSGILVGGNLKTLETLTGTRSDLNTKNCLLFVEDTNENLYSIDRMFRHFKRCGKLDQLAGIIIGGFKIKPDDPGEDFGRTLYDIVRDQIRDFNYPLCFDFPVGHQKNNYALKCGVKHELDVNEKSVTLKELRD